jgi:hypothetical protein
VAETIRNQHDQVPAQGSAMRIQNAAFALAMALAAPGANSQAVTPGQVFPTNLLTVRAPNSDGWRLVKSTARNIAFIRTGPSDDESYVAQVTLFSLLPSKDPDDFIAQIRNGFDFNLTSGQFQTLESQFEYSEARGYPCVKFAGLTEDKQAPKSWFKREHMKIQDQSLYCRYPKKPELGFEIGFSHRGAAVVQDLAAEAQSFIEGVQVTGQ